MHPRCPSREHDPIAHYIPGCELDVWLNRAHVELIGASCRICAEHLFGLGDRTQPRKISEWRAATELFGPGGLGSAATRGSEL